MKFSKTKYSALLLGVAFTGLLIPDSARAFDTQLDNGIDIRFDNTFQYSVLERTAPENSYFTLSPNANDGDNNLRAGIVSNRLDLLTKFDISYQGFGFDTTVDSFYDTVYNQHTQNNDPYTYNSASEPSYKFPNATTTQSGRNIELRNLFIYGSQNIGNVPVTLRVGRLVNIFGESLFFAANGIAYGTSPIDINRAVSVPNTQAKDLFLPVGQALITVQPSESVSVSAYYMFEWEKYNFTPVGSYFSGVDLLDAGGSRIIFAPPTSYSPGVYAYRGPDQSGADTGQFGIAVHYDPPTANYDLGFYALQYNDSEPQVYTHLLAVPKFIPPFSVEAATYQLVYPDHIQIYGVSGSTTVGATNFAGEVSARTNDPLVSTVTLFPGQTANNSDSPAYAKGNTLHYQASAIYLGSATPLYAGSSWLTEVAGDNLLGFTKNRENFDTTQRHMALGLRTVFSANYYHVMPGLDLAVPIGLGWNFMGKAPDTQGFNNTGIDRGGDLTLGVTFTFRNVWTGGISYTYYISPPGRDPYADRDFVQFDIERTI